MNPENVPRSIAALISAVVAPVDRIAFSISKRAPFLTVTFGRAGRVGAVGRAGPRAAAGGVLAGLSGAFLGTLVPRLSASRLTLGRVRNQ